MILECERCHTEYVLPLMLCPTCRGVLSQPADGKEPPSPKPDQLSQTIEEVTSKDYYYRNNKLLRILADLFDRGSAYQVKEPLLNLEQKLMQRQEPILETLKSICTAVEKYITSVDCQQIHSHCSGASCCEETNKNLSKLWGKGE